MRAPVLVLTALLALSGCSGGSHPVATPTATEPAGPSVLAAGKGDLPLQPGSYLSPDGFVPTLTLAVPAGWTSSHRGDDAFDLSLSEQSVVVALITPTDTRSGTALARMRKATTGKVTDVAGTLAGLPATGFEVVGGTGQLVASPSATLAVDAVPGGHLRVLGTDVDGVPLIAVVSVADGSRWNALIASAQQLLAEVTPA